MIKDVKDRFDDYSISPMIIQVYCVGDIIDLKMICNDLFFVHIKIRYNQLSIDGLLKKLKDQCHNGRGKGSSAKYYIVNKKKSIETCLKKKMK